MSDKNTERPKRFERNDNRTRDRSNERIKDRTCYRCEEKGHIASRCYSEKPPINRSERNINTVTLDDEEETELYPALRRNTRSESRKERNLLSKPTTPLTRKIETIPDEVFEPTKKRNPPKPREPSIIDQTPPYNVVEDLLNQPAKATYG